PPGLEREEVERELEVCDQHFRPCALAALAALVVEDAGAALPAVDPVQRAAKVDRAFSRKGRWQLEVRSEALLGRRWTQPREGIELSRAEEPLEGAPRACLSERPEPGMAGRRDERVLASGGLDGFRHEILGHRSWIGVGEAEREEALHQLLECLVEELA